MTQGFEDNFVGKIICGDCLSVMADWPDNCIDTIITDPPYGLGFMGKDWDTFKQGYLGPKRKADEKRKPRTDGRTVAAWGNGADAGTYDHSRNAEFQQWFAVWAKEALRIAKPGAFMLVFGGTRTYHRLTCAIEDVGWQIRDCMMWLFGSGFPKSHDISKAIDKAKGAKGKEYIDKDFLRRNPDSGQSEKGIINKGHFDGREAAIRNAPATDLAKLWDGWGTALKPAHEIIIVAEKPLTYKELTGIMAHKIRSILCQLKSYAKTAKKSSLLNHRGLSVVFPDSVVWDAVEKSNTPADLLGLTDTLRLWTEIPISLSIGLLWLNTLAVIYSQASTFTTETVTSLTTDLKILNSLRSAITPENLIKAATGQLGIGSNAETVASIFTAARMKLKGIPTVSAQDNVTLRPNYEPILVAMKPLDGTFAHNAEKHGVAGLNIDGGRIQHNENLSIERKVNKKLDTCGQGWGFRAVSRGNQGRWPANVILDEEAGAMLDEQSGESVSKAQARHNAPSPNLCMSGDNLGHISFGHNDSGGASRFFYCPKASRAERNAGLEGIEAKPIEGRDIGQDIRNVPFKQRTSPVQNSHPTVKPLKLMEYLCELTKTPTGGIVLDCFGGSGTTAMACVNTGRKYILIESNPDYCEIAKRRLDGARQQYSLLEPNKEA